MSDLEFTFEENPLDAALAAAQVSGRLSATSFLTMMEGETEDALEEALLELESRGIMLDISDLPKAAGTGEAAVRLRREEQLVKDFEQKVKSKL